MIAASVQLSGFPSRAARSPVVVTVADGATVRDLVIALRDQHPEVPELQQLRPEQLVIAVNDRMIKGLDKPLQAGNEDSVRVSVMIPAPGRGLIALLIRFRPAIPDAAVRDVTVRDVAVLDADFPDPVDPDHR